MPFTITQLPNTVTAEPLFMGTVDNGTPLVSATFNGRSYTAVPEGAYWSIRIPPGHAITRTGSYTLTATVGGQSLSMTTNFAPPLSEVLDTPTFVIPDSGAIITVTNTAASATVDQFMGLSSDTSTSCDLFGTVQGMASELTRTVRDAAGNVIGTIKESTASIVSSIKTSLGEVFGGSGGFLNTIKGYIASAASWASDMQASMMESANEAIQWTKDLIRTGQSTVYNAVVAARAQMASVKNSVDGFITSLQSKFASVMSIVTNATTALTGWISSARSAIAQIPSVIGDAVKGIAMASCNTINTVLAGTPSDAFANITNGATSASVKAFGAAKGVFTSGAENIADVYSTIMDSTGVGDVFLGVGDSATSIKNAVATSATSTATSVTAGVNGLRAASAAKPVMPS